MDYNDAMLESMTGAQIRCLYNQSPIIFEAFKYGWNVGSNYSQRGHLFAICPPIGHRCWAWLGTIYEQIDLTIPGCPEFKIIIPNYCTLENLPLYT